MSHADRSKESNVAHTLVPYAVPTVEMHEHGIFIVTAASDLELRGVIIEGEAWTSWFYKDKPMCVAVAAPGNN